MKSKLEMNTKWGRPFLLVNMQISLTKERMVIHYFNRHFHKTVDCTLWEHSFLDIFSSLENSPPRLFLILVTGLIWSLCYASSLTISLMKIYSHCFLLSFSFFPFLSSLKFKTRNSTSQIPWNRHFTFQYHYQQPFYAKIHLNYG